MALGAEESNKVYLYLGLLESQISVELSHWCNNLTWAGPGWLKSHQTDKDAHKRIYIGCHRVYRFLSGTYRCNIRAQVHKHTRAQASVAFIFTIYVTKRAAIWVISPPDFGSDLRYWMTRGNHIEPRYDQIQGRPLMPYAGTPLDHVLTHNTGSLLIPSLLQLTFPLKDNITQLPTSCFWQEQYMCLRQCAQVCFFFCLCVSHFLCAEYHHVSDWFNSVSCSGTYSGLWQPAINHVVSDVKKYTSGFWKSVLWFHKPFLLVALFLIVFMVTHLICC